MVGSRGEEESFPHLVPLPSPWACLPTSARHPLPSLEDFLQEPQEHKGSLCWRGLELGVEAGAAQALSAVRPRAAVCSGWAFCHPDVPVGLRVTYQTPAPLSSGDGMGRRLCRSQASVQGRGRVPWQGGGDLFSPEVWPLRDLRDDGGRGRVGMAPCPGVSEHRMPELLWVSGAHVASLLGWPDIRTPPEPPASLP